MTAAFSSPRPIWKLSVVLKFKSQDVESVKKDPLDCGGKIIRRKEQTDLIKTEKQPQGGRVGETKTRLVVILQKPHTATFGSQQ